MAKGIIGMANLLCDQLMEMNNDYLDSLSDRREKMIDAIVEALESAFSFGKLGR